MKKLLLSLFLIVGISVSSFAQYSQVESFIGEIRLFAGPYAPAGWAFCNGQQISISQNQALYAVIGTTYGGDGRSYFSLPDLRGRVPVHSGQQTAPDVPFVQLGQKLGSTSVVLNQNNLPFVLAPTAKLQKNDTTGVSINQPAPNPNPIPYNSYQPSLGLNYIICLYGIFPMRD